MEENIKELEQIQYLSEHEFYSYIEKLLEAGTLESLANLLELAIYINHCKNSYNEILNTACNDFVFEFTMDCIDFNFSPFIYYDSPNSLSFFISNYIMLTLNDANSIIDNINQATAMMNYKFILNYVSFSHQIRNKIWKELAK